MAFRNRLQTTLTYTSGPFGSWQVQLCFQWNNASSHLGEYLAPVHKHGAILVIAPDNNSNLIKTFFPMLEVGMCLYQLIMHKYTHIAQLNSTTLHV